MKKYSVNRRGRIKPPIEPVGQSAFLIIRLNALCLHQSIPLLWRGGRRSLTGWLHHVCTSQFPSCEGEMSSTDTLGRSHRICTRRRSLIIGVVVACLYQSTPSAQMLTLCSFLSIFDDRFILLIYYYNYSLWNLKISIVCF